jgi:hypothetical protein
MNLYAVIETFMVEQPFALDDSSLPVAEERGISLRGVPREQLP